MTVKKNVFESILDKADEIINNTTLSLDERLMNICKLLDAKVDYYDWVGFYLVDDKDNEMLNLAQYVGEPTDHIRIKFGEGICGQAADREETFVIQDVSKENNYLSCSIKVKSEIVVPISANGKVIGELDIDSHTKDVFTEEDSEYLEKLCRMVSKLF